jgi:hypothetical protein
VSDEPQAEQEPSLPDTPGEPSLAPARQDQERDEADASGEQEPGDAAAQSPDPTSPRVALDRRQVQQLLVIGMIGLFLTAFVLAEIFSGPHGGGALSAGLSYLDVSSREHVTEVVSRSEGPPAGGNHKPTWQNCGFYDMAIDTGAAVHSLEHGAVWLTYSQDLSSTDLDLLRNISARRAKVLVSRWDGELPTPLVASAWGAQQPLASASDPALEVFLRRFESGLGSPEHDGPCSDGQS